MYTFVYVLCIYTFPHACAKDPWVCAKETFTCAKVPYTDVLEFYVRAKEP